MRIVFCVRRVFCLKFNTKIMEVNITPTTDSKTRKRIRNTAEWKRNQQKKIRLVLYEALSAKTDYATNF